MELFERIQLILDKKKLSRTQAAEALGIHQSSFNRWFCVEQQDKLAPHLWAMLELWPDIPRNFLFFGESEEKKAEEPLTREEFYRLKKEKAALMAEVRAKLERLEEICTIFETSCQPKR